MKVSRLFSIENLCLLAIAFISTLFLSPKWMFPLAAWINLVILLRFYRSNSWQGYLLSIPILTGASIIANHGVIPIPLPGMIVFLLVGTILGLLPYVVDRTAGPWIPAWGKPLLFPLVAILFQYVMDQGPQGTWGNIAYSQFEWLPLMQIASITGIYGIGFLLYWFASFVNEIWERREKQEEMPLLSWMMPASLIFVLLFGMARLNSQSQIKGKAKMAAITMDNLDVAKEMYAAAFGRQIEIPKDVAQSDPRLAELQKGMLAFMETPNDPRFVGVYTALDQMLDRYIAATRTAAQKGSMIISWSEAAIVNLKSREGAYQAMIADLADELDVYLFFPTAVFHADLVGKEANFIENKVLAFGPDGELLNTYFKNIPVMGVEPSFPGDGNIPVIPTPYGNLSPIICYDADHPRLMDQLSFQDTDLLVVPTGDWKAISPYHTHMAAVRCIEHGVSMLKSTSNGLSAMIDDKGRMLASYDFFDEKEVKMLVEEMEITSSETMYPRSFPIFLFFVVGSTIGLCALAMGRWGWQKWKKQLLRS